MATTKKRNGRIGMMRSNGRNLRRKAARLQRKTTSLRRDAERAAEDIGHWVEQQADSVGEVVKRRPTLMVGAMSAAAAGLLGWYLGRQAE